MDFASLWIFQAECGWKPLRFNHGCRLWGVLSDDTKVWEVGFTGHLDNCTILCAELIAIKRGLLLARSSGVKKLIWHSDSLLAVGLISKGLRMHHLHSCLISDIAFLLC